MLPEIAATGSIATATLDLVKSAFKLAQKYRQADLQSAISELLGKVMELAEENYNLRGEVRTLKEQAEIQGQLLYKNATSWRKLQDGKEDGPFCPRCWEYEKKLIHMRQSTTNTYEGYPHAFCPQCRYENGTPQIHF
jgi:hypothetical protein